MAQGYGQYCPIAHALEVLGERWSLLIVRDMIVGRSRFNELARSLPGLSRSLLTKRLRQLEAAGIVEQLDGEYLLTEAGQDLEPIVFGLGEWGAKWVFDEPRESELDAALLVWWMHTRLDVSELPERRVVLRLDFEDDPRPFWLLVEQGSASVCMTDPGFGVDVSLRSDLASMYEVWLGKLELRSAMRSGRVTLAGEQALTRRIPKVFELSPVAQMVAETDRAKAAARA